MQNSQKVASNFIWRLMERFGAQAVSLVVSIIIARLLDPEVFGIVALVTVFTSILQVFVDSGLGNALIQKKDADDLDFSSVFFFNLFVCILLYALMFFSAPLIANFYEMPKLVPVVRVISLILVISGVKNIQQAYVSRYLLFKKFFFATLAGTIASAVVGIYMAYKGYGVWALVVQNLTNQFIDTLFLWITVKWKPSIKFSFDRLKSLLRYGWKLLASSLIETIYKRLRSLIIGKIYSSADLAFYDRGELFPQALVSNVSTSVDSVLLPTMSAEQDDRERVKSMTRRAIKLSTYVMMPLMVGMAVCAEPFVSLILTDKWLPCVPFLRIFCITYAFFSIHTANLNAIKAIGRSDIILKLEVAKKVCGFTILLLFMNKGPLAIAYSMLILEVCGQLINTWPNKKLLNYGYLSQVKDMLPQIGISIAMGVPVYLVGSLGFGSAITLLIQIPLGVIIYVVLSLLFKIDSFEYIRNLVFGFIGKKKNTVKGD